MNDVTWTTNNSQVAYVVLSPRVPVVVACTFLLGMLAFGSTPPLHATEDDGAQTDSGIGDSVRVRPLSEPRKFFSMLQQQAYCFEFSGGWIECWIEVEEDGEVTRYGDVLGERLRNLRTEAVKHVNVLPKPTGQLLWVIRREETKEVWDLAIRLDRYTESHGFSTHCSGIVPPQASGRHHMQQRSAISESEDSAKVLLVLEHMGHQHDEIVRTAKLKYRVID